MLSSRAFGNLSIDLLASTLTLELVLASALQKIYFCLSEWVILKYPITQNYPQPSTTTHNHPQLFPTTHNHPQPSTTTHNHPQLSTTTHNHPQPPTTLHNHLQPTATSHNHPQPPTTIHNDPQPPNNYLKKPRLVKSSDVTPLQMLMLKQTLSFDSDTKLWHIYMCVRVCVNVPYKSLH